MSFLMFFRDSDQESRAVRTCKNTKLPPQTPGAQRSDAQTEFGGNFKPLLRPASLCAETAQPCDIPLLFF